jgi:hypothetical protein
MNNDITAKEYLDKVKIDFPNEEAKKWFIQGFDTGYAIVIWEGKKLEPINYFAEAMIDSLTRIREE